LNKKKKSKAIPTREAQERGEREIRRVMKFYFIKGLHNEHEKYVVY